MRTRVVELEVVFLEIGMAEITLVFVSAAWSNIVMLRIRTSASTSTTTS